MNTFRANNESSRLHLSGDFRSICFHFTAEALEWLSGTTSDDSSTPIANRNLFYDLLRRMRFMVGRDESFRRPQRVQAGAFQFSEIGLAAKWNMGRKQIHNLLMTMERVGLIVVHYSRVASIAAMTCVAGWTDSDGNFVKTLIAARIVPTNRLTSLINAPHISLIAAPHCLAMGRVEIRGKEVCEICQGITFAAATAILGALAACRRLTEHSPNTVLAGSHLDCCTSLNHS